MRQPTSAFYGVFVACMSAIISGPAQADDERLITWQTFDAPPLIIQTGPDTNTGVIDGIRELIQKEMPSHRHENKLLPYKRFLAYAKAGKRICTPYLYKNSEREKYMVYSDPAVVFPKPQAIVRTSTYEQLGRPTHVSLHHLLGDMKMKMSTNKVRSYGDHIDGVIAQYEKNYQINRHPGSTTRIFQMVARERSDFVLDLPSRISYWTKTLGLNQKDFRTLPISESAPTMVSYIACPNSPWGRGVIEKVNRILEQNIPKESYLGFLQRWSNGFHKVMIEDLYHRHLLKPYLQRNRIQEKQTL